MTMTSQGDDTDGTQRMTFFEAILPKDAVIYLATDSLMAPLVTAIECDTTMQRRFR